MLRTFEEADKAGRIQKIILDFHIKGAISLTIDELAMDQTNHDRFAAEMAAAGLQSGIHRDSPVHFVKSNEKVPFNEFLTARANEHGDGNAQGEYPMRLYPDAGRFLSLVERRSISALSPSGISTPTKPK